MTVRAVLFVQKSKFGMQITFPRTKSNFVYSRSRLFKARCLCTHIPLRANFRDFKRRASLSKRIPNIASIDRIELLCDKIWRHAAWQFFLPQLFLMVKSAARYECLRNCEIARQPGRYLVLNNWDE